MSHIKENKNNDEFYNSIGGIFILLLRKETKIDLGNKEISFYLAGNAEEILMKDIEAEETPLWVELWPAAIGLARWLWDGPELKGKKVLELGCGLGLSGLVAGLKSGEVTQTDYIKEALEIAKDSAVLNGLNNITQAIADWRDFQIEERFDLIIGSDIIYHPNLHHYLMNIFENNLQLQGSIIVSDPGRKDGQNFVNKLQQKGWKVKVDKIHVKVDNYLYPIDIYKLNRHQ